MKKKILATVLAGIMVISMAAGCAKPEVTLGEYKGLTLTDITQKTVDDELAAILAEHSELVETARPAQEGDTVNINFVGKLNGEPFSGGSNETEAGMDLVLGSGSFIDGFEDGLVGAKKGQTLDLDLTFPDPYENNPDLAGKAVVFTVTVNAVKEKQIPELTDELVKEITEEHYTTTAEYLEALEESLRTENFYNQIADSVTKSSTVKNLPEDDVVLLQTEMINMYTSYASYYASMYGISEEYGLMLLGFSSTADLKAYAEEYAKASVTNELIFNKIAEAEGIKVTDELYDTKLAEYTENMGYETTDELLEAYGEDQIRFNIIYEACMDLIIESSTIVEGTDEAVTE